MNKKIIILGKGGGSIEGAVRYDEPQQLTDEQKKQAQENLGIDLSANLKREIVDALPSEGEQNIIYMVAKQESATGNVYDEYMYINGQWELIGSTEVDLSDYYKKGEVDAMVNAIPKHWFGTKEEYEAIVEKDENTIYHIEGGDSMWFGTQAQYDALTEKEKDVLYFIEGTGGDYYTKEETDTAIQGVKETLQGEIDGKVDNDTYEAKISEIEGVLEGKADRTEIPSLAGYATETWVEGKGYLTEHQSLDNYYTKGEVDNAIGVVYNFNITNDNEYELKDQARAILEGIIRGEKVIVEYRHPSNTQLITLSYDYIVDVDNYQFDLGIHNYNATNQNTWHFYGSDLNTLVMQTTFLQIPSKTSELVFELADGTTKTINVVVKEG